MMQLSLLAPCRGRSRRRLLAKSDSDSLFGKELYVVNLPVLRERKSKTPADDNGNGVRNLILAGLSRNEHKQVLPALEPVTLPLHHELYEAGEVMAAGYFLNDGMASVLTVEVDGQSIEVGLIGNEGFVGSPLAFGFKTSALRVMIQADATGYRVDAGAMRRLLASCPGLERQIQRFAILLGMQTTQLAACNRLHQVEGRLARWLLMSHDRIGSKVLPLTQEFLGQMLGVRRATVSVAASVLQKAGMIVYARGQVSILDRGKLKGMACDCYETIHQQNSKWQAEVR